MVVAVSTSDLHAEGLLTENTSAAIFTYEDQYVALYACTVQV